MRLLSLTNCLSLRVLALTSIHSTALELPQPVQLSVDTPPPPPAFFPHPTEPLTTTWSTLSGQI